MSELDAIEARIDAVAAATARRRTRCSWPSIAASPASGRWYVRLRGEEKDFTTIWLTLGQRTLHYETYVMPAPEENQEQFYEHLLRRNAKLVGAAVLRRRSRTRSTSSAQLPVRRCRRRRARSRRGLALRVRRAVLPPGPAHRVRLAISLLTSQCISCHSAVAPRAAGSLVRGSPVSQCALGPRGARTPNLWRRDGTPAPRRWWTDGRGPARRPAHRRMGEA